MPIAPFLSWLLLIWLLGWLALPVARRIWGDAPHGLPDAGLAAGRMLGLVTWTLLAFWAGNMGLATRWSVLFLAPLGAFCLWLARRDASALKATIRARWRGLLVSDAVFLSVFFLFFLLRGFWPDQSDWFDPVANVQRMGEKPMDIALIGACARADYLPPPNPYAAGVRLSSYYYLGHLQTALLTDAIHSTPRWTYNLMCATLPALCFSILAALCGALTNRIRNGVGAACLVLALGTLEPLRQWRAIGSMAPSGAPRRWWPLDYFSTSRVIPFVDKGQPYYTINEYPWFTFSYADLHAHYFAMPVALLLLSLGWALHGRVAGGWSNRGWKIIAVFCAVVLSAQIVTNTWDFPIYTLFIAFCLASMPFFPGWRRAAVTPVATTKGKKKNAPPPKPAPPRSGVLPLRVAQAVLTAGAIAFAALIAAAPYLLRLKTSATRPTALEQPASPTGDWLLMWGPMIAAWILTLIFAAIGRASFAAAEQKMSVSHFVLGQRQFALFALALPLLAWLYLRLTSGQDYFVLILLLTLIFWTARDAFLRDDARHVWLCRVALCGLLALLWSETTWAGFLGKPYHRQDTVFKFGLQAWYLLGTAATCAALRWKGSTPAATDGGETSHDDTPSTAIATSWWPATARLVFVPLLCVMAIAAAASTTARARQFESLAGWDAWGHLAPPERAAADWLQSHARDGDHLIEAAMQDAAGNPGGDYTEFSRFTHVTGISTVVGPNAHTFQWGMEFSEVANRNNLVRFFYTTQDAAARAEILQKYGVRYVVCGELERTQYGAENVARVEKSLPQLYFSGDSSDPRRVTIRGVP